MRFGIQPFNFDAMISIVSDDGSYDISRFNYPSVVGRCVEKGYRVIELGLDMGYMLPNSLNKKTASELMKIKETNGITYTAHLPMWSIELASPNELIRKTSVDVLVSALRLSEPLEPEAYVIHATGALATEFSKLDVDQFYRNFICDQMSSLAEKSIKELLSETGLEPRKLAIETVDFPFKFMRKILDQHDLSICLDTGHLLAGYVGDYKFMEFLEENFDRMIEIHLHDGYREEGRNGMKIVRDHLPLGKGKLPIAEMFDFLQRNNYTHPIIFELTLNEAAQSLKVIREKCPKTIQMS